MRRDISVSLGLAAIVVMLTATRAPAQTTAVGPYLATPAWDQKLLCDTMATCPRFIVLSNWDSAAVLDRETGLVWDRSPSEATFTWENAHLFCNEVTAGNRLGWRLPAYQELASLMDLSIPVSGIPRLPAGHPFSGVQPTEYWSATIFDSSTTGAWALNVTFASRNRALQTSPKLAWCVRGGQGSDLQ
jgi:hypothetical protein